jgi:RNA polymerase sigma-70 factor (sigma-E family)
MSSPAASADRAFHEFFLAHRTDLARLARRLTGETDAADDLAAEALLQVWRCWERVAAADSPPAYARGIVATLARNRLRRLSREREVLSGLVDGADLGRPSYQGSDVDAVMDVREALAHLTRGRRACVVLRYGYGLSERDTAQVLGVSVGTVKSQTSRAAAQLVRILSAW